jgi:hypothetical protein
MRDLDRIAPRQRLERGRQFGLRRHRRAIDQHWNDPNIPLERRFDLDPHIVRWIIEPPFTRGIPGRQPTRTDDCDESAAIGDLLVERVDKVDARLDRIDIDEKLVALEMLEQAVEQAPSRSLAVAAPIIDENASLSRAVAANCKPVSN